MNHQDLDVIDVGNPKLKQKRLEERHIKNKQSSNGGNILPATGKKIKDEEEGFTSLSKKDYVGLDIGKQIQQVRMSKKITQKQLAQQLNVTPAIVQSHENGKAIRNNSTLARFEKILGVKLKR